MAVQIHVNMVSQFKSTATIFGEDIKQANMFIGIAEPQGMLSEIMHKQ